MNELVKERVSSVLLTASELPVDVAVLDQHDSAIAQLAATLLLLHEDRAVISLPARSVDAYLRWGTRVRFWMSDGTHGYEVTGAVVAHDAASTDDLSRRVVVRLWECQPRNQKRLLPRCRVRFPVALRSGEAVVGVPGEPQWEAGWSVDLGAGGMRLRTHCRYRWARQIEVKFRLPTERKTPESSKFASEPADMGHEFCLLARVLRLTLPQAQTRAMELAVSFELLTLEDGLSLASFLHGE